jgi:hypothetical protein
MPKPTQNTHTEILEHQITKVCNHLEQRVAQCYNAVYCLQSGNEYARLEAKAPAQTARSKQINPDTHQRSFATTSATHIHAHIAC